MTDSNTPAPPEPPDDGIAETPEPTPESSGVGPGGTPSAQRSSGSKGGCMTAMIGLFAIIAALLGVVSQL